MATASVLLADDNPAILIHVGKLLKKDKKYEVVGAVNCGDDVLRECSRLRPDIIILDISLGDVSGIDLARNLLDSGCRSKIVFLTVHEDSDFMNAAIGAGASAYVIKSRLSTDLLLAVNAALSGKIFVSSSLFYHPH